MLQIEQKVINYTVHTTLISEEELVLFCRVLVQDVLNQTLYFNKHLFARY